jgi:parafibromin
MATDSIPSDPLLSLRRAIAAQALPSPTTSADISTAAENVTDDLAQASHLFFSSSNPPHTIPLNTATRFVSAASNDTPVDLRSIFFAWQKKDVAIPEYIASAQQVNDTLNNKNNGGEKQEQILNLVFVERLDLITWLEGASDDSEYIKPLEGAAAAAEAAAVAAAAASAAPTTAAVLEEAAVPVPTVPTAAAAAGPGARPAKVIDPRLQEIYNGERKLGDRNTVLRGIKPTVCSN